MKKKKSYTNSSKDKIDTKRLSKQVAQLLNDSAPKDIMGMLALARELDDGLLFEYRWKLGVIDRNDYYIEDTRSNTIVYDHIALFENAVKMVWYLTKPIKTPCPVDKIIYTLDQEYYRCMEDIKHYRARKTENLELRDLFTMRLEQSMYRLHDIKTEISKIY